MKKLKKGAMAQPMGADPFKPKPVSIHIHAEGNNLKDAHKDLASQLKPHGFMMKKKKKGAPAKKSIADALSS